MIKELSSGSHSPARILQFNDKSSVSPWEHGSPDPLGTDVDVVCNGVTSHARGEKGTAS